jgi:tripartite-type tricarboxylate transporter receptor subunit TctC
VPGFEVLGFMGLFAPAKLPPAIAARLNSEVVDILQSPDMVERFAALGMRPRTSTQEEFASRVKRDHALWKSVVNAAGLKPE